MQVHNAQVIVVDGDLVGFDFGAVEGALPLARSGGEAERSRAESRRTFSVVEWNRSAPGEAAQELVSRGNERGTFQDFRIPIEKISCKSQAHYGTSHSSVSVTIQPSSPSDAEIIAQLRKQLGATQNQLQWAELKIEALEARLRKLRIDKYGPGSEKLSDAQLELLELEPGVSGAEVQTESQRPKIPATTKPRQKHPGRQPLPPELPRVEKIVPCTEEQCVCPGCGGQRDIIGYEESEQLDVEPAKYFARVIKREKRACAKCKAGGVVAAPLPPRIIEKGLASDAIVIDTVVSKYCDHLPLYRQSAILERDAGVDVSRATLDDWVLHVGELLVPLVGAMGQELLSGSYIQADETPVLVQMHDGRGKNHQAYLWQYGCPGGNVIFDFRLGRERDGPKKFLGRFNGILQSDGYAAYDQIGGPNLVHVGCWAHGQRYFAQALELNPHDPLAPPILASIRELFAIDAQARAQRLTLEARHVLRQEKSRPLLGIIRQQVEATRSQVLPASALAKACNYVLGQWDRLVRCLDYPQVELSNNWAENSMRPVAVGRKKLDSHRQLASGAENRCHPFAPGELSPAKDSCA